MATITEKLYLPYNELSRFLEKLPEGMTYDLLQTKIPSLRQLNKKELSQLLDYTKGRSRIIITPTTRKGEPSSPHLRHKMHSTPITSLSEPAAEAAPGVVHIASLGKPALSAQKPITEPAAPKDTPTFPLAGVVQAVMKNLENAPQGLTRTELARKVYKYHQLDAYGRMQVLSHLRDHEGVVEMKEDPNGAAIGAPRFITAEHYAAQQKNKDVYLPASDTTVQVKQPTPEEIEGLILQLLEKGEGKLPHFRLANYIPALENVSVLKLRAITDAMVRDGKLFNYMDEHPNENHRFVIWISLKKPTEVVQSFGETAATTAMGEALRAAELNAKSDVPVTPTPVALPEAVVPQSSLDVRKQIVELEALARSLEEKEKSAEILATIKPIRDEIVKEFVAAQDALTAQIDALAALGAAIEKLNGVLDV